MNYKLIWSNDKEIRDSASGGAFYLIARSFIRNFGTAARVYGCVIDENNKVMHASVDSIEALKLLQGSKYVQSNITNCFKDIQNNLESGHYVLFSGTSCQVGAIKKYLNGSYENLYLIDLICHGVPSPLLWEKYVKFLEERYKGNISNIKFRNKSKTNRMGYLFTFDCNGKKYKIFPDEDWYYQAFLDGRSVRPSCYKCPFIKDNADSDLSIGDSANRKFHPFETISLAIPHSHKGIEMLAFIAENCEIADTTLDEECFENRKLIEATEDKGQHKEFYKKAIQDSSLNMSKHISKITVIKNRLKNCIPIQIKETAKNIINKK